MQPTAWRPRPLEVQIKSRRRRRRRRPLFDHRPLVEVVTATKTRSSESIALFIQIIIIVTTLLHLQPASFRGTPNLWLGQRQQQHLNFPSARLVYAREATSATTRALTIDATTTTSGVPSALPPKWPNTSASFAMRRHEKIAALHEQLNQLKRQLDAQLHAEETAEGRTNNQAAASEQDEPHLAPRLGSPCLQSSDCSKSIKHSHCSAANFTCVCLDQHVPINASTCLQPSLLGYECQVDAQCQQKVAHSLCQAGKCACPQGALVPYRKSKCLAASKIGEFCLSDGQCQLNDAHSSCKWRIQNVYGTCKCPPNYKQIQFANSSSIKCAPRLGDACLSEAECQLATANSTCAQPTGGQSPPTKGAWPTSSASSARCTCAQNFVWSANQLECEPLQRLAAATTTTSVAPPQASGQQESHKYEMIVIPTASSQQVDGSQQTTIKTTTTPLPLLDDHQLEIKIFQDPRTSGLSSTPPKSTPAPSSFSSTTKPPRQASNSEAASGMKTNSTIRMSSLGKACESALECKARDPHSDCVNGFCNCVAPSARCSANSTGCHRDTFQCRNGQCISWYFVCDHFPNCDDGSDETDCKRHNCPREAFQCRADGLCVARGKLCDGKRDCSDASDELNCTQFSGISAATTTTNDAKAAATTTTSSTASNQSVSAALDTNINPLTTSVRATCPENAFACASGQCLPAYVFCNAVSDCPDASDEDEILCERPRSWRRWQEHAARHHHQDQRQQAQASSSSPPPLTSGRENGPAAPAALNPLKADGDDLLRLPVSLPPLPPQAPVRSQAAWQPNASPSTNPLAAAAADESPLIKTDRASIERLAAALALTGRTPESRGRQRAISAGQQRRRSKLLTNTKLESHQGQLVAGGSRRPPDECPRWAFTCANGKCRSSAILCSGVDGCGDNSDEDRCEVCQCEAPA